MRYILAVTSCGRFDLLRATIDSFINCADTEPVKTIIVEDSDAPMPDFLKARRGVSWHSNSQRMGQWYSVSKLINLVSREDVEYVFWLEDDWNFVESNFLSRSQEILQKHPEIISVSLRGNDCNGHPLVKDTHYPFLIQEPSWRGGWGGFSLNPSLFRLQDLKDIRKHLGHGFFKPGLGPELELSKAMLAAGRRIATLSRSDNTHQPIVVHTGGGRSRAIELLEPQKLPKVLIAIPACDKFDYGKWESDDSPAYNERTNYNHQPYGTGIHISGGLNPRIDAIRETWWKDIPTHPTMTGKFFYGTPHNRPAADDEVFLNVPGDYAHLPLRTYEICQYALKNGYDYVFKCDDDTIVYVDRLLEEIQDYRPDHGGYLHGRVCSGGPGYILSRKGMAAVQNNPSEWAEDVWVSKCLFSADIEPTMLVNHRPGFEDHWIFGTKFDPAKLTVDMVSAHAVQPDVMKDWYAHKQSN